MEVRKVGDTFILNFKDMDGVLRVLVVKKEEDAWQKLSSFLKIKPEVARMMGLI